jgi:hypothetical protein
MISVDPAALRNLAADASGLSDRLGDVAESGGSMPESVVGHANLAAAIGEFKTAWLGRGQAIGEELRDASAYLATVADTFGGADGAMSGE